MASTILKTRRIVITVAVTAITATGVWYGAGLKIRQEIKQNQITQHELSPAEQIERLGRARAGLIAQRTGLEVKISELARRKAEREDKAASRESQ